MANKRCLLLFFPSPSSSPHHDHKPPFQQNPTLKSARASDLHCTVNQIVHDFCSRQLFSLKINTKKIENPPIKPHTQRCQSPPHRIDGHLFFFSVPEEKKTLPPDRTTTKTPSPSSSSQLLLVDFFWFIPFFWFFGQPFLVFPSNNPSTRRFLHSESDRLHHEELHPLTPTGLLCYPHPTTSTASFFNLYLSSFIARSFDLSFVTHSLLASSFSGESISKSANDQLYSLHCAALPSLHQPSIRPSSPSSHLLITSSI